MIIHIFFNDFSILLNYVVGWQSRSFLAVFFAIFSEKYGTLVQTFWGEFGVNASVVGPLKRFAISLILCLNIIFWG